MLLCLQERGSCKRVECRAERRNPEVGTLAVGILVESVDFVSELLSRSLMSW